MKLDALDSPEIIIDLFAERLEDIPSPLKEWYAPHDFNAAVVYFYGTKEKIVTGYLERAEYDKMPRGLAISNLKKVTQNRFHSSTKKTLDNPEQIVRIKP